jgi:hypothetical protein
MSGAALCTKVVRLSVAYRSTLRYGTITDNLITLSTISNGLNKPDDHWVRAGITASELQVNNAGMLLECLPDVQIATPASPPAVPTVVIMKALGDEATTRPTEEV